MPVAKPWEPHNDDVGIELLGNEGDWALWYRGTVNGWHNFRLQPPEQLRKTKSVFRGAWNGKRLVDNRDMQMLAEHHVEIYLELEQRCPTLEWDFSE